MRQSGWRFFALRSELTTFTVRLLELDAELLELAFGKVGESLGETTRNHDRLALVLDLDERRRFHLVVVRASLIPAHPGLPSLGDSHECSPVDPEKREAPGGRAS